MDHHHHVLPCLGGQLRVFISLFLLGAKTPLLRFCLSSSSVIYDTFFKSIIIAYFQPHINILMYCHKPQQFKRSFPYSIDGMMYIYRFVISIEYLHLSNPDGS